MKGLFLGQMHIDLHFFTDHYPVEGDKLDASRSCCCVGGSGATAATTFSHLGGSAKLCTSIGKNPYSEMVRSQLAGFDVEVCDLSASEFIEPAFNVILSNMAEGSQTIVKNHRNEPVNCTTQVVSEALDIALFDGNYTKCSTEIAKKCRALGITTVLYGSKWRTGTDVLLKFIDIAICSQGFFPPHAASRENATQYLLSKGIGKTAITRGSKPVVANEGQASFLVDVPEVEVVDCFAAGHIFAGAFCYAYTKDASFQAALEYAADLSSYSCRFEGSKQWMWEI
jgi:sugar/nucleoside kinase (ribokinase family)